MQHELKEHIDRLFARGLELTDKPEPTAWEYNPYGPQYNTNVRMSDVARSLITNSGVLMYRKGTKVQEAYGRPGTEPLNGYIPAFIDNGRTRKLLLPYEHFFRDQTAFDHIVAHEMAHWTGKHTKRWSIDPELMHDLFFKATVLKLVPEGYIALAKGAEEVTAEAAAYAYRRVLGIGEDNLDEHADYLQGPLKTYLYAERAGALGAPASKDFDNMKDEALRAAELLLRVTNDPNWRTSE